MRLRLTGDHICEWLDDEPSAPGPRQVQFETEYASGKYGTYAAMLDSDTFGETRLEPETRLFLPVEHSDAERKPVRFGTTATGVVTQVGEQVTTFAPGDRVVALGDICDVNTVNVEDVWPLGDLDPLLALCVEPAYVAFHCIRESGVRYGDTVAVVGLGALGQIAVQMARQAGAAHVVAIDLSAGRRETAKRLGADVAIDPSATDPALELRRVLGSPGADVAIELTGVPAALNTAIRCVRVTGTVCAAGFYRGEGRGLFLGRESHHNRITIVVPHGCGWGHEPRDWPRWDRARAYEVLLDQMRSGRLEVAEIVSVVTGVDDAPDLFRRTRDEPDNVIKFAVEFKVGSRVQP